MPDLDRQHGNSLWNQVDVHRLNHSSLQDFCSPRRGFPSRLYPFDDELEEGEIVTRAALDVLQVEGTTVYDLQTDSARARLVPAWGNNCVNLKWRDHPILEAVAWEELAAKPTSYGIPILFPFPNRVAGGKFEFSGKIYRVDPPRHGFVRSRPWIVTDTSNGEDEVSVTALFESHLHSDISIDAYPSSFSLEATYRLRDDMLVLEYAARNTGQHYLPLGLGIHPYFRRPKKGTLQVPANQIWELQDSLPTGKKLAVGPDRDLRQPRDVNALELDDIYSDLIASPQGTVRCRLVDLENQIETCVSFSRDEFPEAVIYTAPHPRQAVCIEPYTCPTDALNLANRGGSRANLVVLPPSQRAHWTIRIGMRQL